MPVHAPRHPVFVSLAAFDLWETVPDNTYYIVEKTEHVGGMVRRLDNPTREELIQEFDRGHDVWTADDFRRLIERIGKVLGAQYNDPAYHAIASDEKRLAVPPSGPVETLEAPVTLPGPNRFERVG